MATEDEDKVQPTLDVEGLTVQYRTGQGDVTAVSNASFTIGEAEFFGLVGESGCGKSTMAKALIGALDKNGEVESGTIRYKGKEIQDYTERELNKKIRWSEISVIPQSAMDSLDPFQRIEDQAAEIAKVHGYDVEEALERFGELFQLVGIDRSRIGDYPHQFSGGMQQRAIIALSLFLEPSLVIADEPTTALDVIMQDQVFRYLDDVKSEIDTSLLLITHDIALVFETCDNIAIMHGGQVAETGSVFDIYDSPRHPYSILLQESFPDARQRGEELVVMDGEPPMNYGPVNECTFADRCPWAIDACWEGEPVMASVNTGGDVPHEVACIRRDEVHELIEDERGFSEGSQGE